MVGVQIVMPAEIVVMSAIAETVALPVRLSVKVALKNVQSVRKKLFAEAAIYAVTA